MNPMGRWPVAKIETEKRRLCILTHLSDTPGYELGDELLRQGCRAQGCPTTEDQVLAAIEWLDEMELVTSETIRNVTLAKLTKAGAAVAKGERVVKGVQRPGPAI
jgi:hypothetical protein